MMMTARKRRAATTVPAIAAIEIPWEGAAVDEADDPEVEVEEVEAVGEGAAEVEDGD